MASPWHFLNDEKPKSEAIGHDDRSSDAGMTSDISSQVDADRYDKESENTSPGDLQKMERPSLPESVLREFDDLQQSDHRMSR